MSRYLYSALVGIIQETLPSSQATPVAHRRSCQGSLPGFSNGRFTSPDFDDSWHLRSSGVRSSNPKRLIFQRPIHSLASEYIPTSSSLRRLIHPYESTSHSFGSHRSRRESTFNNWGCELNVSGDNQLVEDALSCCRSAT